MPWGKYEKIDQLGKGGFATVWKAKHLETGELVAIKEFLPKRLESEVGRKRFLREAEIVSELIHPGIPRYVEHSLTGNTGYIVLQYVDGTDLRELTKRKSISTEVALGICWDILDILAYMGSLQPPSGTSAGKSPMIHRDIKPENILFVERTGRAMLVDFGLALRLDDPVPKEDINKLAGTIRYMAPEQLRAEIDFLDPRSDLYSLAAVLYELIEGRVIFEGKFEDELKAAILNEPVAPMVFADEQLARVCMKCLEKLASLRWQSTERFKSMVTPLPAFPPSWPPEGDTTYAEMTEIQVQDERSRRKIDFLAVVACTMDQPESMILSDYSNLDDQMSDLFEYWTKRFRGRVCSQSPITAAFGLLDPPEIAAVAARNACKDFLREARMLAEQQGDQIADELEFRLVADFSNLEIEEQSTGLKITGTLINKLLRKADPWTITYSDRFLSMDRPDLPFVGRKNDMANLEQMWKETCEGTGQVVIVQGKAGMGKTRLVREFLQQVEDSGVPHARLHFHCSAFHKKTGFYSIQNELKRHVQQSEAESLADYLEELGIGEYTDILHALLDSQETSVEKKTELEGVPHQPGNPNIRKAIQAWMMALAKGRPIILLVEDAHWCDDSTRKTLIDISNKPEQRVLLTATARPPEKTEDEIRPEPLEIHPNQYPLALRSMNRGHIIEMLEKLGKSYEPEWVDQTLHLTKGNPYFVTTLIQFGSNEGAPIPTNLKSITYQRVRDLDGHVLSYAALLGHGFSANLMAKLLEPNLSPVEIEEQLAKLLQERILRYIPETKQFAFEHALSRRTLLELIPEPERYIKRILRIIESFFPALLRRSPEVFADFFARTGNIERAIEFYQEAAGNNARTSSFQEALALLHEAVGLVKKLPNENIRNQKEAKLRFLMANFRLSLRGYGDEEIEGLIQRSIELSHNFLDPKLYVHASWLLGTYYVGRAQLSDAIRIGDDILAFAKNQGKGGTVFFQFGFTLKSVSEFYMGHYADSEAFGRQAVRFYSEVFAPEGMQDPAVIAHVYLTRTLLHLGREEEAFAEIRKAENILAERPNPFDEAFINHFAGWAHYTMGRPEKARECAEKQIQLGEKHGLLFWQITGRLYELASRTELDEQGIQEYVTVLQNYERNGVNIGLQKYYQYQINLYLQLGLIEQAREAIQPAWHILYEKYPEDRFGEEYLHILIGKVSLAEGGDPCPHFVKALHIAQQSGSVQGECVAKELLQQHCPDQGGSCALPPQQA